MKRKKNRKNGVNRNAILFCLTRKKDTGDNVGAVLKRLDDCYLLLAHGRR